MGGGGSEHNVLLLMLTLQLSLEILRKSVLVWANHHAAFTDHHEYTEICTEAD